MKVPEHSAKKSVRFDPSIYEQSYHPRTQTQVPRKLIPRAYDYDESREQLQNENHDPALNDRSFEGGDFIGQGFRD